MSLDWLQTHGDLLYAYALRRVRRPETAEDMVQETLLSAVQGWAAFAGRSSVKTWLVGILRHKIADHFREHYRNERPDSVLTDEENVFDRRGGWKRPAPHWAGDPTALAERSEFRAVMAACVSKLPARTAYLFTRRAEETASMGELCEELAITADHAWTLMHRARLRLRECLGVQWFGNDRAAGGKPR